MLADVSSEHALVPQEPTTAAAVAVESVIPAIPPDPGDPSMPTDTFQAPEWPDGSTQPPVHHISTVDPPLALSQVVVATDTAAQPVTSDRAAGVYYIGICIYCLNLVDKMENYPISNSSFGVRFRENPICVYYWSHLYTKSDSYW